MCGDGTMKAHCTRSHKYIFMRVDGCWGWFVGWTDAVADADATMGRYMDRKSVFVYAKGGAYVCLSVSVRCASVRTPTQHTHTNTPEPHAGRSISIRMPLSCAPHSPAFRPYAACGYSSDG